MRRILIVLAIFGAMAIAAPSSYAGVGVNINIGVPLPPPVVVQAPPEMVIIPEAGVYVAVGTPYDLFFLSGRYYYFHNGYWGKKDRRGFQPLRSTGLAAMAVRGFMSRIERFPAV